MDTQEPVKTAEAEASEIPGMKAALDRMKPEFWHGLSSFARPKPTEFQKKVVFPVKVALAKLDLLLDRPDLLATALPFVQNLRLKRALSDIASIPEGAALVEAAAGVPKIHLDPNPTVSGGQFCTTRSINGTDLSVIAREINIAGLATLGGIVAVLTHELQHKRQMDHKVLNAIHDKAPSPIELLWHNRMTEADAEATAIDIAWKLKENGKPEAWTHIRTARDWPIALAAEYEKKALADPSSVASGAAKRAAFDAWFDAFNGGVSVMYNEQGISKTPAPEGLEEMHKAGKPFAPLTVADMEKIGDIGPVNYLKLPGGKPLDSPDYRRADFDQDAAEKLRKAHDVYDRVSQGKYETGPAASAVPVTTCSSFTKAPEPAKTAAAPVSLKRPATTMRM
ncbi:MAG: hypothetical protein K0R10_2153 [Alphaproteobacteria bacterium]|jgi:hypothetical protein|nr:hypothetical protein [Alphaproteobacteria bacterium]